jgi:hypothetical protein
MVTTMVQLRHRRATIFRHAGGEMKRIEAGLGDRAPRGKKNRERAAKLVVKPGLRKCGALPESALRRVRGQ